MKEVSDGRSVVRRSAIRTREAPTFSDQVRRLLFRTVWVLTCRFSPVAAHAWRSLILRCFGASIGSNVHVYPSARIWAPWNLIMASKSCLASDVDCYSVDRVFVGAGAVISQRSFLCAASHDFNDPNFPLITGEIRIEAGAWVAAEAFVGPGVTVGAGAVVAARAVVVRDVEPNSVIAGNPARKVGSRRVERGVGSHL